MKKLISFLIIIAILSFIISLFLGPTSILISNIYSLTSTEKLILFDIRLPRLIGAFIIGSSLALSGACFQAILRNPLADPFVLGVSSGAGLGAVLVMLWLGFSALIPIIAGSFIGAVLSIFSVLFIATRIGKMSIYYIVLSGVIINSFLSAFTLLTIYFSHDRLNHLIYWLMGDLSQLNWTQTLILSCGFLIALLYIGFQSNALNILAMGDSIAHSLGINPNSFRKKILLVTSLLTALCVTFCGIIGFIGLIIPHIIRILVKDDFRYLLPISSLAGGTLLILTDTIARCSISPTELPIGVITAFFGAPFFLWIMRTSSR